MELKPGKIVDRIDWALSNEIKQEQLFTDETLFTCKESLANPVKQSLFDLPPVPLFESTQVNTQQLLPSTEAPVPHQTQMRLPDTQPPFFHTQPPLPNTQPQLQQQPPSPPPTQNKASISQKKHSQLLPKAQIESAKVQNKPIFSTSEIALLRVSSKIDDLTSALNKNGTLGNISLPSSSNNMLRNSNNQPRSSSADRPQPKGAHNFQQHLFI